MDYRDMGRYINTAVLLCGGQAEQMVVFIDGAAYGAQRVMAVGQYIGKGEFRQTACPGCLDDAHIRNIMRCQRIKFDLQLRFRTDVMSRQNPGGDAAFFGVFHGFFAVFLFK